MIYDRYYGVEFYGAFNHTLIPVPIDPIIVWSDYDTVLTLLTADGGLKGKWHYHQRSVSPVSKIQCERTLKGCGSGEVVFAYLDLPIDAGDVFEIRFRGDLVYEAIVENDVEISDPTAKLKPRTEKLKGVLFTGSYPIGVSVKDILEDVITASETDTGIIWDSDSVDVGITPPQLAVEYNDSLANKVIDEIVKLAGSDFYWGVGPDRVFFVRQYSTDTIHRRFYVQDNPVCGKVKINKDYSQVKLTRAHVWKKNTSTKELAFVGAVGYGGSYPVLEIENKIGKIEGVLTASEYLQDADALTWAYESLRRDARQRQQISIDSVDIQEYVPEPGDNIMAEDGIKPALLPICSCESVTGWTGGVLSPGTGRDKSASIEIFGSAVEAVYDMGRVDSWYKQKKIGFYMAGTVRKLVSVAFSETTDPDESEFFSFCLTGKLGYYSFPVTWSFRYCVFRTDVVDPVNVDEIQVFCETKQQYQDIVSKVSWGWTREAIEVSIDAGDVINPESEELQLLERKISILETIDKI